MAERHQTAPLSDFITINISFNLPKSLAANLDNWLFEYVSNFHIEKVTKDSDLNYTVAARIQEQLINIPKTLEDSMKAHKFARMLQKELADATETVKMYHELTEKDEIELKNLRKKVIDQTYTIEKLAKENIKLLDDKRNIDNFDSEKLMIMMEQEKKELLERAESIKETMKLLTIKDDSETPSQFDIDFLPPV